MGLWVVSKRRLEVSRLKLLLENAITTRMLKEGLKKNEYGKTRVEEVLDAYGTREGWNLAKRAKYYPLFRLFDLVRKGLDWDEETFLKGIKSPTTRRLIKNVFETVLEHGIKMPQVFAAPLMVVWNYTYRCNLRCRHCYQDAGTLGRENPLRSTLTFKEKLEVVDEIASYNIPTLSFSGGEPFIEKDIWEVAARAREHGLYVSANSNGTLIDREAAGRLKELDFAYVAVSIDAADPEVHDGFRGVQGMWARSIEGIRSLLECGVTTCLSFTLTNYNYDQLPGVFKLREELGAYKVIVYNFIPTGRGDYGDDLGAETREEAYAVMFDELEKGTHVVATTAPQFGRYCKSHCGSSVVLSHMGDVKASEIGVIADLVGGCGVARCYLALQPDGDVTPCVYMPRTVIGNLRHERLGDIWEKSELLQSMRKRDNLWGHCAVCDHKMLCGGCRARAQAYFGDLTAPDIGCIHNKAYAGRARYGTRFDTDRVAAGSWKRGYGT